MRYMGCDVMRRVVITGLGALSPCGPDTESTWAGISAGKSGIAPLTCFDPSGYSVRIGGEVKGFSPEKWIEKKKVKEGDRFIHFALAASKMAVADAHYEPTDRERERIGTLIGVGLGGLDFIEKTAKVLAEKGPNRVTPYFIPASIANLAAVAKRRSRRSPSRVSRRCGRSRRATTTRNGRAVPSIKVATVSSSPKAPAWCSSKNARPR
jgi:3-oxoacyl-[acyl-carrier-protein] synthase II